MTDLPDNETIEMPKAYEAAIVEDKWYRFWMENGYFRAEINKDKKPFVITMPPPNVTGELHIGHALTDTLEDIMTRWHRMKGEAALWLPGFDHAGIATQVVVERQLAKEGMTRHQLGREKFLERVWQWAGECRDKIRKQHQRLGSSCDWSRECFTLDDGPSKAVRTVFVNLYRKGLIYRGERIINWCPRCTTALSDLEVNHQNVAGKLYYIRYRFAEGEGYITVATTRPETLLGDTGVAVNPEDERYSEIIGKKVIVPFVNRMVPVVADEAIDLSFGTGALKVTPAHDPVDFEIGQRHELEIINVLNPDATLNAHAGPYKGIDRFVAREQIIKDLEKEGLLVKIEAHNHAVGHCQRCHTMLEPLTSRQWFVHMEELAKPAMAAVREERLKILPERFAKVYFEWLENIRDWCISRQLWWGHRIPVWYCAKCGKLTVSVATPEKCEHCGAVDIEQDPDVLDTWFSSALWTHSTLGWPDETEDLKYFYPTMVMETGYDILFFWVARMVMMGIEDTDNIPFSTIYLHGLVRDANGEKMSKVRGNVINPLDTLEEYGTDALRFALSTGTAPGNDIKMTAARLEAGRNFANKLWNATRFVLGKVDADAEYKINKDKLTIDDRWILSRLNRVVASVLTQMEEFQFGEAQKQLYDFLWGDFCDWYIEIAKIRLSNDDDNSPLPVLLHVLDLSLRMLHPYMPFITEELWQHLKDHLPESKKLPESIMIAAYPEADMKMVDNKAEEVMASVIEIVHAIRNARAEYRVSSGKWIAANIYGGAVTIEIKPYLTAIENLARVKPVSLYDGRRDSQTANMEMVLLLKGTDVVIPMAGMLDIEAEKIRLQKEIANMENQIGRLEKRLSNSAFRSKAPQAVIDKETQKATNYQERLVRLRQELEKLS